MEFIPLQTGQAALLVGQPLICDILDQTGYEVRGNTILYSKDITLNGVSAVDMLLVILDVNNYDDFTPLPLPAEMAWQVVDEVYKSFVPELQLAMQQAQVNQ